MDLSQTTSRLSISGDVKVLESLRQAASETGRRDSAISFESLDELASASANGTGAGASSGPGNGPSSGNGPGPSPSGPSAKRRVSSTAVSKPPKQHKRKGKRSQDLSIVVDDSEPVTLFWIRTLLTLIYSDLPVQKKPPVRVTGTDNVKKVVVCFVGGLTREGLVPGSSDPGAGPGASSDPESTTTVPSTGTTPGKASPSPGPATVPIPSPGPANGPANGLRMFSSALLTKGPGDKKNVFPPMEAITTLRLTKNERKTQLQHLQTTKITIKDLLLTANILKYQDYPLHSQVIESELPPGWVETAPFSHDGSHIFSLDCEFCETSCGKDLARISLVNFQGDVVYDTYVVPANPITDYLTKYSGITPELLDGVRTTLADVQARFLELVSSEDILIGHSLNSDLNILKIRHPNIVDTVSCYEHARGRPYRPGLKYLTKTFLHRDIQLGEDLGLGHSSIEDAKACLDLVKLKINEGMLFGLNDQSASVFDKINDSRTRMGKELIRSLVVDYRYLNSQTETQKCFDVCSDDEVMEIYQREIEATDVAVINLRELEAAKGWSSPCEVRKDLDTSYRQLDERLDQIYAQLPENSVFVVSGIYGTDLAEHLKLKRVRTEYEQKKKRGENLEDLGAAETWDEEKIEQLNEAMGRVRDNICFFTIKGRPSTEGRREED